MPASRLEAIPKVKTDDPPMATEDPKLSPLLHHETNPKPRTSMANHKTKRMTMVAGPT